MVKNVDFADGASEIKVEAKGQGKLFVYADNLPKTIEDESTALAVIEIVDSSYKVLSNDFSTPLEGLHDLYFVMNKKDICFKNWSVK